MSYSTKKQDITGIYWVECKIEEIAASFKTIFRALQMKWMEYNHFNKKKENDFQLDRNSIAKPKKEGIYDDATQNQVKTG